MTPCVDHGSKGDSFGYLRITRGGKHYLAHRWAYAVAHDTSIASLDGVVVRHSCDNARCINPDHLQLGSQADNVADMMRRGRHRALSNETHGSTVYPDELVGRIRAAHDEGGVTIRQLAALYGVGKSHIHNIIKGKNRNG